MGGTEVLPEVSKIKGRWRERDELLKLMG